MPEALYESFAQVLSLCQSMKDDLAAILDPETGFAPRLRQLCRDQYADIHYLHNHGSTQYASQTSRV
jgi:nuclear pore complex protein Nup107